MRQPDRQQPDQNFEARCRELVEATAAVLDVESGLAEALHRADEDNVLIGRLHDALDIEGGLHAILNPHGNEKPRTQDDSLSALAAPPTLPPSGSPNTYTPDPLGDTTQTTAPDKPANGKLTGRFPSLPPHQRLAARLWFPTDELSDLRAAADNAHVALALALALTLARDLAFELERALGLERDLERARGLTRDLERALARALTLAPALIPPRDLTRDLDRSLDRARGLTCGLERDLARAGARNLIRSLDRSLDRGHDLIRDLEHARDRSLDRVLVHARCAWDAAYGADRGRFEDDPSGSGFAADLERAYTSYEELIQTIDRLNQAVTSMTDADLSDVDLRGIPLKGVRWSTGTRWPAESEDQIRRDSVEIKPGLWEIRGGIHRTVDATV